MTVATVAQIAGLHVGTVESCAPTEIKVMHRIRCAAGHCFQYRSASGLSPAQWLRIDAQRGWRSGWPDYACGNRARPIRPTCDW